jgi:hypothetical protein
MEQTEELRRSTVFPIRFVALGVVALTILRRVHGRH